MEVYNNPPLNDEHLRGGELKKNVYFPIHHFTTHVISGFISLLQTVAGVEIMQLFLSLCL